MSYVFRSVTVKMNFIIAQHNIFTSSNKQRRRFFNKVNIAAEGLAESWNVKQTVDSPIRLVVWCRRSVEHWKKGVE